MNKEYQALQLVLRMNNGAILGGVQESLWNALKLAFLEQHHVSFMLQVSQKMFGSVW